MLVGAFNKVKALLEAFFIHWKFCYVPSTGLIETTHLGLDVGDGEDGVGLGGGGVLAAAGQVRLRVLPVGGGQRPLHVVEAEQRQLVTVQ